jgi:two-component system, OmpR family, sensor histidine kinase KdpD
MLREGYKAWTGEIQLALDDDLPPLRADPAQLERAFANLLENAVRRGGGKPVVVRAHTVVPRLVVRSVDRGPGIPLAEHQGATFVVSLPINGSA